jgi:hypothetical protein
MSFMDIGYHDLLAAYQQQQAESEDQHALIQRQGRLLAEVVEAIRGPAPPNGLWSVHDAADLVRDLVAERNALIARMQKTVESLRIDSFTLSTRAMFLEKDLNDAQERHAKLADFSHGG